MSQFRQSTVRACRCAILAVGAMALVSGAGTVLAQTTIITQEPVPGSTVVTPAPLQLTSHHRA